MQTVALGGKKAAGRVAMVDDEKYELVMRHKWHLVEYPPKRPGLRFRGPYAMANIQRPDGTWTSVMMHTLITGYRLVDHEDHNGLNNQQYNLRDASITENTRNGRGHLTRKSKFKGVSWKGWEARITVDRKTHHLGFFDDEEEAARAYDNAAREMHGEFAYTNFGLDE